MDSTRRCIGLDVHRDFAQVAVWQDGLVRQAGRLDATPEGVREFAAGLGPADEVALEVTGNTWAIAAVLASHAGLVVVSDPARTRAIAEAKARTGKGRRGNPGRTARGGLPAGGDGQLACGTGITRQPVLGGLLKRIPASRIEPTSRPAAQLWNPTACPTFERGSRRPRSAEHLPR
ncbi:MAG TPA: hypothetical protein VIJ82_32980 [Streptosporangiaceae bacterium]